MSPPILYGKAQGLEPKTSANPAKHKDTSLNLVRGVYPKTLTVEPILAAGDARSPALNPLPRTALKFMALIFEPWTTHRRGSLAAGIYEFDESHLHETDDDSDQDEKEDDDEKQFDVWLYEDANLVGQRFQQGEVSFPPWILNLGPWILETQAEIPTRGASILGSGVLNLEEN